MSQPTKGDVHVNKPLTNISIARIQSSTDFVAGKVFPVVSVAKQSDRYFVYDKKQWFRSNAKKRAPSTMAARGGYTIDNTPSYFADVWAFGKEVPDQLRANADMPIDMDRDATLFVTQQLLLAKEKDFVSKNFGTGKWTGSSTGSDITVSTKWDAAGSDPVDDIMVQKIAMKEKTGFTANKIVVVPSVDRALKNNASIIDRIKHTQVGSVTNDMLARLLELDEYLVAYATEDDANEGAAASMDFVFGDEGALLVHAASSPAILTPSAGYTFAWSGLFGAGAAGMRIKKYRDENLASDIVEGEMAFDHKLVAADLGVFFSDVLT